MVTRMTCETAVLTNNAGDWWPVLVKTEHSYEKYEAKASRFSAGMKPTNSIQPPSME